MLHTNDEMPPPVPPMARSGQIETDMFCTACHYNLHGQAVSLDERLGFLVCRCPECGRFQPAGVGVSANSVWLRRAASALLAVWAGIIVVAYLAILCFMFGMDMGGVGAYTYTEGVLANGQLVQPWYQQPAMVAGGNVPQQASLQPVRYVFLLYPWFPGQLSPDSPQPPTLAIIAFSGFSLAAGLLLGVLGVAMLWHWPRRRYAFLAALPLIPFLVAWMALGGSRMYDYIRSETHLRIFAQASVQVIGIAIGILIGRRVARTLIRVLIPPKPRQALAFMWTIDGKTLPLAKS